MSPYEIVAWMFVILVGAATLASALVLLLVWRGMRDERDEMYVRSRMRAALPASDERTHVRLVPDPVPVAMHLDGRAIAEELKRYKQRGGDV